MFLGATRRAPALISVDAISRSPSAAAGRCRSRSPAVPHAAAGGKCLRNSSLTSSAMQAATVCGYITPHHVMRMHNATYPYHGSTLRIHTSHPHHTSTPPIHTTHPRHTSSQCYALLMQRTESVRCCSSAADRPKINIASPPHSCSRRAPTPEVSTAERSYSS